MTDPADTNAADPDADPAAPDPDDHREPYIPVRVADLIDLLCTEAGTPEHAPPDAADQGAFRQFARAAAGRMHARFRGLLGDLKNAYAPFDPDSDTHQLRELGDADKLSRLGGLFRAFDVLLTGAGFHRMTRPEIEETMQGASHWGVEMSVSWDVFSKVDVYYRGKGVGLRTRRVWWHFFRTEELQVPTFRRVVIILKQQDHARLGPAADTSSVFLKLFKDIPQMDIEMLLPGTRLRMPRLERGKLGGSAASSLAYVMLKLSGVSLTGLFSGSLLAIYTPLVLIGGYAYKTLYSFQVSRRSYMLHLTQSLYFQNLDTNAGVLHRLFDDAEEQDLRQVLLAYFFLWRFGGPAGLRVPDLDRMIESDIERRIGEKVEVNTGVAVGRLERYGAVTRVGDRAVAVPVRSATAALDAQTQKAKPSDRPSRYVARPATP